MKDKRSRKRGFPEPADLNPSFSVSWAFHPVGVGCIPPGWAGSGGIVGLWHFDVDVICSVADPTVLTSLSIPGVEQLCVGEMRSV